MDILTLAQINNLKKGGGVGYIEPVRVLFPEQTLTFRNNRPSGSVVYEGNILELVVGNRYCVYWQGKEYLCTCLLYADSGDRTLVGYDGETLQFDLRYEPDRNLTRMMPGEAGTFTVRVETPAIIHTIDPKFLHDGVGYIETEST